MNRLVPSLAIIALLTATLLPQILHAEDPDYGNDYTTAQAIDPNGMTIHGAVEPSGDEDWFSFSATAHGVYEITLTSDSGTKYVHVYGPPEQLPQITYQYTSGTITFLVYLDQTDTHYLKVRYGSGNYQLSLQEIGVFDTDAFPDTCNDPATLVVDAPAIGECLTQDGADEDWLTITTETLHMYEISFLRSVESNVYWQLFQTDCGPSLYLSTPPPGSVTFVSWAAENYDLRLFNSTGYYEIAVEDLGPQPDDHANTYDAATPITNDGDLYDGVLNYTADVHSDEDWFSFSAAADGVYEITLSSESDTKYVHVYSPPDEWGQLSEIIYQYTSGTTSFLLHLDQTDTHYLKVRYGSGSYHLSVREIGVFDTDAFPDTCSDPCALVVDAPAIGECLTKDGADEDWLSIATETLHLYEITFMHSVESSVYWQLLETDCGPSLYFSTPPPGSLTFVSWADENYDLRLFNSTGYYEIAVEDLGPQPDDHANTYDAATPITNDGALYEGSIDYAADVHSDEDWFSFLAPLAGTYQVTLSSQAGTKYVHVYSPPDQWGQLSQIAYNYTSTTTSFPVTLDTPDTYYLKVRSGSGNYHISVVSPEPLCGDLEHQYPTGDVSGPTGTPDCYVDLYDLAALAAHWLTCSDPGPPCSYNP